MSKRRCEQRTVRRMLEWMEGRLLFSTIYVDANAAGTQDGTTWETAYLDLQAALAAAVAGDEIRVADGTYKPSSTGNRQRSFQLKSGVSVLGGYAGFGAADPDARDISAHETVLSGDIGMPGDTADNSFHVLVGSGTDSSALIDGFTVTAGRATGDFGSGEWHGAGMYNLDGNPSVVNCTFRQNVAYTLGGGMYNRRSSPLVINCTFVENEVILLHSANAAGGGMYNGQGSSPTVTGCRFFGNKSSNVGGAVALGGGVVYAGDNPVPTSPVFTNCVFSGNSAAISGGGMYTPGSRPILANCTFSANSASYGGAIYIQNPDFSIANSIVWGNAAISGSQIYVLNGSALATHSLIQDGLDGAGNISEDPLFMDADGADNVFGTPDDDLRLRPASPAADKGNNAAAGLASVTTDAAGLLRFMDIPSTPDKGVGVAPVVDMGAYEAVAALDVEAGGTYRVIEGSEIVLTGHGASDHPGALIYEWDWDGDGHFDDAIGAAPTFSASNLLGPQKLNVRLRVTDSLGRSISDNAVVKILPVVIYVDDSAAGAGTGGSWTDAHPSLQTALEEALPGNEIRVAQGTYRPTSGTDRNISFRLRNGVSLRGGYAGVGAADPNARDVGIYASILSGDIGAVGSNVDNSYHVVNGSDTDNSVLLEGFTITDGNAPRNVRVGDINIILAAVPSGGGMYNHRSAATIRDCTFLRNYAYEGGGMANNRSATILINCTFYGNLAAPERGESFGGGGLLNYLSAPLLVNCVFVGNQASDGGGVSNRLSSPSFRNCTFSGNRAVFTGGAVYNLGNHGVRPEFINTIMWGNSDIFLNSDYQMDPSYTFSAVTFTYGNIQGGWNGEGNINANPRFVRNPSSGPDGVWGTTDDDYGDLRLQSTSPSLDRGSNAGVPFGVVTDRAGNPRYSDIPGVNDPTSIVDMGAFERSGSASLTSVNHAFLFDTSHALRFGFSGPLQAASLEPSDLVVVNLDTLLPVSVIATPSADTSTYSGTWTFASLLPDGNYRATLVPESFSDLAGNTMQVSDSLDFFVLTGDANRDRKVDLFDLVILATNWMGTGKNFSQGDFNYDGTVNSTDLAILGSKWQQRLDAPQPAAPAPTSAVTRPPVRTPTRIIELVN